MSHPRLDLVADEAPTSKMACLKCGSTIQRDDIRILFGKKGQHIRCYQPIDNVCFDDFRGTGYLSAHNKATLSKYVQKWREEQFEKRRNKHAKFAKQRNMGDFPPTTSSLPHISSSPPSSILPETVWALVFTHLCLFDLSQASLVCKLWHNVSLSDIIWKELMEKEFPNVKKPRIKEDDSWKHTFFRFCLSADKITGPCGACGKEKSSPFEPTMQFLCNKCPKPFETSDMIPVAKLLLKASKLSPDDVLQYTGYGPFRTRIDKSVGFNAWATITVPAYPAELIALATRRKQEAVDQQKEAKEILKEKAKETKKKNQTRAKKLEVGKIDNKQHKQEERKEKEDEEQAPTGRKRKAVTKRKKTPMSDESEEEKENADSDEDYKEKGGKKKGKKAK